MANIARHTPRWADQVRIWFAPPEWTPDGVKAIPEVERETFERWDVPLAKGLAPYVITQFALFATAGTVWLLLVEDIMSWGWLGLLAVSVLWGTWSWGQLFHRNAVGVSSELARLVMLPAVALVLLLGSPFVLPITAAVTVVAAASIGWLMAHRASWTESPSAESSPVPAK